MEKLSKKNTFIIGLTLFSMFFGAGNLIFPPFLGEQAGQVTWIAFAGFALSAIGLPILGVAAIARSGGLKHLAGRVHPLFAAGFTFLIYLSIGPGLAMPRTAGVSFEMAVVPFIGATEDLALLQFIYSIVFFAIAYVVALKPDQLSERLGKRLTPILLTLIGVIFIGALFSPLKEYGIAAEAYKNLPWIQGFIDGYQTMDTLAALNFGIIIAMNIRALGIKTEKGVVRETIKAGFIAGALLLIIYAALTHVGALAGGTYASSENGAQTLTTSVSTFFGTPGLVILGIVFLIACLNTCIGLISCCSEYFHSIFPKFTYQHWALFFSIISMIIANAGLTAILKFTIPVLNFLYPISIILIILAFLHPKIKDNPYIYKTTILLTALTGLSYAIDPQTVLFPFMKQIPLYSSGLGFLLPALVGLIIGYLWAKIKPQQDLQA